MSRCGPGRRALGVCRLVVARGAGAHLVRSSDGRHPGSGVRPERGARDTNRMSDGSPYAWGADFRLICVNGHPIGAAAAQREN